MTDEDFHTCRAERVYQLKTDAPDAEALINLAEQLSGGLESHDLGDAMGAFMTYLDQEIIMSEDGLVQDLMIPGDGFTVTLSVHWELFQWGAELTPDPLIEGWENQRDEDDDA